MPPIRSEDDNHVLDHPHIFLNEVMRQARESDIICLSMDIRDRKRIKAFKGNDVQVFNKKDLSEGMLLWADQILVATNKQRQDINFYMRNILGKGENPEIGDKIICGRNCWDIMSDVQRNPLINGTIGTISNLTVTQIPYIIFGNYIYSKVLVTGIDTFNDHFSTIGIDYKALTEGEKFFSPKQEYYIRQNRNNNEPPIEFSYGYAITTHRAQGSQWNKVLVIEERFPFDRLEHDRWLYTACTRASRRLTVVLKD